MAMKFSRYINAGRLIIIVVFVMLFAGAVVVAMDIGPLTVPEIYISKTHESQISMTMQNKVFENKN